VIRLLPDEEEAEEADVIIPPPVMVIAVESGVAPELDFGVAIGEVTAGGGDIGEDFNGLDGPMERTATAASGFRGRAARAPKPLDIIACGDPILIYRV